MGPIRNSEVKQLFLNVKLEFGGSKIPFFAFLIWILFTLFIAPPFCNLSFYYNIAEVLGVARGILKIELFSFCHPQGYP